MRGELRAALRFLSAGERRGPLSRHLATLSREHDRAASFDALAAALCDYAELAVRNATKLEALPAFDPSLIYEANSLATALRERPPRSVALEPRKRARALRDRLPTLLLKRIALHRRTSRYFSRRHPALVRESTSAYERGRRKRGKGSGRGGEGR